MKLESATPLEVFMKSVPASRMQYPQAFQDRLKYFLWRLYTPCHPFFRDTAVSLRILKHDQRQDFILGKIAPHLTAKDFIGYLIDRGFRNHFVAWRDPGESVSLRYVKDFTYQYHIRVFEDGEVRGHYEYTPECHPVLHIRQIGMEERREEFKRILGDRVV